MKKLYLILAIILAVMAFAGFIFWRYFFLATVKLDPQPTNATILVDDKPTLEKTLHLPNGIHTIEVSLPGYRTEKFQIKTSYGSHLNKRITLIELPHPTKVLNGPLTSFATNDDRKKIFFARNNVLYNYELTAPAGTPAIPITPELTDITGIDWSNDFLLALLHKKDGEVGLYDFNRYDLLHQEYRSLGNNFLQAAWSNDGTGIYAEYRDEQTGEHSMVKTDRTGSSLTRLAPMIGFPMKDYTFVQASPTSLIFSSLNFKDPANLVLFDTHQRTFTVLTDSQAAYGPVLSPDKSKLAFTDNGELVSATSDGKNRRNLGVRVKPYNYSYIDSTSLVAFDSNLITVINTNDGTKKEYEVYAPSNDIDHFTAYSDSRTAYYLYQGNLYLLTYNPEVKVQPSPSPTPVLPAR